MICILGQALNDLAELLGSRRHVAKVRDFMVDEGMIQNGDVFHNFFHFFTSNINRILISIRYTTVSEVFYVIINLFIQIRESFSDIAGAEGF